MPNSSETAIATTSVIKQLRLQGASLLLYASVFNDPLGQTFLELLDRLQTSEDELACLQTYSHWFQLLADWGDSWGSYIQMRLLLDDNPFTRQVQRQSWSDLPSSLKSAVHHDLAVLDTISNCSPQHICEWIQGMASDGRSPIPWSPTREVESPVAEMSEEGSSQNSQTALRSHPIWDQLSSTSDWSSLAESLAAYHHQAGAGLFAQYRALRWHGHQLVGIAQPDPIRLENLAAYAIPRQALVQNTEALLAGYPALNVLLYGSRGSGKSSLVKALLNEYGDRGLRLIEVAKSDLQHLPSMVDAMRNLPQKFIIFVDDLSFEDDDDVYKSLKVVLEGSLTARPQNVVVYATSNRRHLVRQFHSDRPRPKDAEEVSAWDTMQEKLSFSDRFGLTLTFEPADQSTYLDIVFHLARQAQLTISDEELAARSLQWATRHNGRSGRSARQFVDALAAEIRLQT
ncbi:MAG: ATP-binding protein [Elainellaceae cyanobacterium]